MLVIGGYDAWNARKAERERRFGKPIPPMPTGFRAIPCPGGYGVVRERDGKAIAHVFDREHPDDNRALRETVWHD